VGADGSPGAAAAPWRAAAAQVLVADLATAQPDDDTAHHLRRVLRLRAGEVVCAADGAGGYRLCRMGADGGLEPDGGIGRVPAPDVELAVGFAPVKADRPEWVVQKLTELGIDRILVLATARSVVRWDGERRVRHLDKLRRVAREAAQQCRRLWLPSIEWSDFDTVAAAGVLADAGGRPLRDGDHLVLVGPEGGWAAEEREGRELVALGEHVLRAETAALVAGSAMASLRLGLTRSDLPSSHPE